MKMEDSENMEWWKW